MRQFDELDKTGSGVLLVKDLAEIVKQLTGISKTQADEFMAGVDANQDGLVDRKEFTDMWSLMFGWQNYRITVASLHIGLEFSSLLISPVGIACRCYYFRLSSFNGPLEDQLSHHLLDRSSAYFQDRYVYGWAWSIRPFVRDRLRNVVTVTDFWAEICKNWYTPSSFCALRFHNGSQCGCTH